MSKETYEFQAEVSQLLKLMIHSLYSNKEIFLRELVSNASDACDKLRFMAVSDDSLYDGDDSLKITVDYNEDERTVTISDTGIGMTRDEVIDSIGTIAKSGTKQFLESLGSDDAKNAQLIGQFGVGFYSSFIVADKVTVVTRKAGQHEAIQWQSEGTGEYTMADAEKDQRGTDVILHLREGEDEFLNDYRLRSIIKKYSEHISLPIMMRKPPEPAADDADKDDAEKDDKAETPTVFEQVNTAQALWTRAKRDISDEEYIEFYKSMSYDFEDPLAWTHNRIEGKLEYTSLFYIPAKAPFDMWDRETTQGIKLYVQRVFILDDSKELMPRYLRFVKGLVDSNDLPLNVSREILQSNKTIDTIRSASVKKILDRLQQMAKDDSEQYQAFWAEFGNALKEGVVEDFSNRDAIAGLFRFASTHNDSSDQTVSLADYIARMPESQDKIYYVTADSYNAAKHSPHLEVFKQKGIEVILMYDRVDEWMISSLREFDGKQLVSIAKGDLELSKDDKKKAEEAQEQSKGLVKRLKEALGDKVDDVKVTTRLVDSPACIVLSEMDMALHMQRLMKQAGHDIPETKPVLEINPEHALVQKADQEADEDVFKNWAHFLFDEALLAEGGQLEDPASFVKRVNDLLMA